MISEKYSGVGTERRWLWTWRRNLFVWEEELVNDLIANLQVSNMSLDEEDLWQWRCDPSQSFSVASAYKLISTSNRVEWDNSLLDGVFKNFGQSIVPPQVLVFSWRLLLDRLPTCVQLRRRGVLVDKNHQLCVFCNAKVEDLQHLFLRCAAVSRIWTVIIWLAVGFEFVLPFDIRNLYLQLGFYFPGRHFRRLRYMFWHVIVWCIWLMRNRVIFNGASTDFETLVSQIQSLSWRLGYRIGVQPGTFFLC